MTQATVKVAFVNEPREGKKMGNIKTHEGDTFWVWAERKAGGACMEDFKKDGTYTIDFTQSEGERGVLKKVNKLVKADVKPNGVASHTSGAFSTPLEISVRDWVAAYLQGLGTSGSPFPNADELARMVDNSRNAWEARMGTKVRSKEVDEETIEFNDEIPF